jgi:hypothetical protein
MIYTDSTSIPASHLLMDKPTDFDKGKVEELARSMQHDGMIHRPVVRPIADRPGFYKVVAGRKRVYAAVKILGWTEVECDVRDVDDEAAESIELAENVFRTALSDEVQLKFLVRWREIYVKRHPNADARLANRTKAATDPAAPQAEKSSEPSENCVVAGPSDTTASRPTPKPFARVLENALGISSSAAKRLDRAAKNLTEDQITVLAAKKVNSGQTDDIAALGNGEAIDHAVKMIGSGINVDEAVRQAKKLKLAMAPKPEKVGKTPKAPAPSHEKELTDDEWLSTYCGTILSILKHKTSFKNDAILYRRMGDAVVRFRSSVKKHLKDMKSSIGHNGAWYSNTYRIINASHPMHWLVCGTCTGTGKNPDAPAEKAEPCKSCFGAAYKMRMEDW